MGKRTARIFFAGVRLFLDRYPERMNDLCIRFIGGGFETDDALCIRPLGLQHVVSLEAARGRSEIPGLMAECYVLLLIANDQRLQVPGKLYEYLGAERRLLTITELEGATADALAGLADSRLAEDAEAVATALDDYWKQYSSGGPAHVDRQKVLSEISYGARVSAFADLIERSSSPMVPGPGIS